MKSMAYPVRAKVWLYQGDNPWHFITAFKKTPGFQPGDELNADMSSPLEETPLLRAGRMSLQLKNPTQMKSKESIFGHAVVPDQFQ